MAIESTRLRFVRAADPQSLVDFIAMLPFKVELKAIQAEKNAWVAFFVLPEMEAIDFKSVDLT